MTYYDILWYIMTYYDIAWYIMMYYDILWYIIRGDDQNIYVYTYKLH